MRSVTPEQACRFTADRLPAIGVPDLDAVDRPDDDGVLVESGELPESRGDEDATLGVGFHLARAGTQRPHGVVRSQALMNLLGEPIGHLAESFDRPDAQAVCTGDDSCR
jgi:hypothetical protein